MLTAELAAAYVTGVQENGVGATPKHYVGNDHETERFTASTEVSERALRELYLLAFEKAVVTARAWLVMSAYNGLNGVTATEHPLLQTPLNDDPSPPRSGVRRLARGRLAPRARALRRPGGDLGHGPAAPKQRESHRS